MPGLPAMHNSTGNLNNHMLMHRSPPQVVNSSSQLQRPQSASNLLGQPQYTTSVSIPVGQPKPFASSRGMKTLGGSARTSPTLPPTGSVGMLPGMNIRGVSPASSYSSLPNSFSAAKLPGSARSTLPSTTRSTPRTAASATNRSEYRDLNFDEAKYPSMLPRQDSFSATASVYTAAGSIQVDTSAAGSIQADTSAAGSMQVYHSAEVPVHVNTVDEQVAEEQERPPVSNKAGMGRMLFSMSLEQPDPNVEEAQAMPEGLKYNPVYAAQPPVVDCSSFEPVQQPSSVPAITTPSNIQRMPLNYAPNVPQEPVKQEQHRALFASSLDPGRTPPGPGPKQDVKQETLLQQKVAMQNTEDETDAVEEKPVANLGPGGFLPPYLGAIGLMLLPLLLI